MKYTRREFLGKSTKLVTSGFLGTTILGYDSDAASMGSSKKSDYTITVPVPKRRLGRTGLDVSTVNLGSIGTNENTVRYAVKNGINFIHTSPSYSGGKSMREVGKGIKGQRDKVFLGLKVKWKWESDKELHKCLDILGTDYVDIIFFPIHNDPNRVASPKTKSTFERWKKQGLARFLGLTTHGGMNRCMEAALEVGWYDCLMPAYQIHQREQYLDIFKKCEKEKVGIIAMKTKIHPSKLDHLPLFFQDKVVSTVCRTMTSLSAVKTYIGAASKQVSLKEAQEINNRECLAALGRCDLCGACTSSCPNGVAVNDIVRCVDYYADFIGDYDASKDNYLAIDNQANADKCMLCETCEVACPNNVPIRYFISRAKKMFC